MEHAIQNHKFSLSSVWTFIILAAMIASMIVIVFGLDSVAPGVHEYFHDVRHSLGFVCH